MSRTEEELAGVLDVLYEGMLDETAWQRSLECVCDFVSGSALALFSIDPSTGGIYRADVARVDPLLMHEYRETWIHQDPRHLAGLTCPVGEPQVDGMTIETRAYHRTSVFNEFLKPADIPFHLATWLERRSSRGVVLSVQGSRARGAFTQDERRRMAVLIPHLRRIIELKDRLAGANATAAGLLETMNRLPFGLLLLSRGLRILEASAAAEAVLDEGSALYADGQQLGFIRKSDARAFARRLNETPCHARLDDRVAVARSDGRSPLSLLILPLKGSQECWTRPAASWLVLIFDPEAALSPPTKALQRALGLTPAEAALAGRLARGVSVAEAAQELQVSRNTVRTQLKSIYVKTGVHSQAQLVRRIVLSGVGFSSTNDA